MQICDLKKEDVKIGIRVVYYHIFGTLNKIHNENGKLMVAFKWDDDYTSYFVPYIGCNLEVFDDSTYFVISIRK